MDAKNRVLRDTFGFSSFRPGQDALIDSILSGRDTLGIMPTGGGKSLCYQVPALVLPGMTIVVSPLISLMQDQVAALKRRGVPARAIFSSMDLSATRVVYAEILSGKIKILYVSPERLMTRRFIKAVLNTEVSMVCVDEAHAIPQWGPEFRPAYLTVSTFLRIFPARPRLAAFTATAAPRVRDAIIDALQMKNPYVLTTGFDRPNLYYEVRHTDSKFKELCALLPRYRGTSGIIYCLTRKTVETLARQLTAAGFPALPYHGGFDAETRTANQERWIHGDCPLIVATNAFGMGIDKPDVRFVIHYNMPADPESYYQEAGRAGRDGLPADCILLASSRDRTVSRFFISRTKSASLQEDMREKLVAMRRYAGSKTCLRQNLLAYFGQRAPDFCGNCSVCLANGRFSKPLPDGVESPALYRDLVHLRSRLAKKEGKRPNRLFSDQSLHDMAAARPVTMADLLAIEGISPISCLKYGRAFLAEIRVYVETDGA